MAEQKWELIHYQTETGNAPFLEWFESLNDSKAQVIIDARLHRLWLGNFGKCESLGSGLFEGINQHKTKISQPHIAIGNTLKRRKNEEKKDTLLPRRSARKAKKS